MNNLQFILFLLFIIIFMTIVITLFFNEVIITIPKDSYKKPWYSWLLDNPFESKHFRGRLKGCHRGKCINGGYCFNCQGHRATCCCYDFQCANKR